MIFRQLFDKSSSTYTYLLASRKGGEALLIDPVFDHVNRYLNCLKNWNCGSSRSLIRISTPIM